MNCKSKYLIFKERILKGREKNGKRCFAILSRKHGDELGLITYYPRWKKYVYNFSWNDVTFDGECGLEVAIFCLQLDDNPSDNIIKKINKVLLRMKITKTI